MEELARAAGVEPVGSVVQHRARPAMRTYVGKGKAEELKEAFARLGAESLIVDDELEPAQQRYLEDALAGARRRPHAADPRHLRAARRQRRGQAPGRARAARVQPAAHARDVAAPRAARRRRRHARPRRDAARDRPPPRAPPHLGRQAPARGGLAPARDASQGTHPHRRADDRARRLHERRQVDAAQRAHRRRRLGRGQAVRDARSDDARLRARGPALPRHRHRRLHPAAAAPARRGLRGDARGDARRRRRAARRRRVAAGGASRRAIARGRQRAARDRRVDAAASCSC